MLKKCLVAMMLAVALVLVISASTATAAPKSEAAVGVSPQDLGSTQVRIIDGDLRLSGHVVKAIGAELVGEGARGFTACANPLVSTNPFVSLFMPPSKGVFLIKFICTLVGRPAGLAVLNGIKLMSTSPGTSPIGDNQCFQFRLQVEPVVPVIVNPSGSC